jgi:hypothetical protein
VWVRVLLWTVLPTGLTLYLIAARYPKRLVLLLVMPLTVMTAASQVVAGRSDTPTWVAFAIYLSGCAYFSTVVCVPNRDRRVALLPGRLLGERFSARLAWTRFEESLTAANAAVRHISDIEHSSDCQATLQGLATEARREAHRGGIWAEAWAAQATWLDALDDVAGIEPSVDQARRVHDLLRDLERAHVRAIERTSVLDPG